MPCTSPLQGYFDGPNGKFRPDKQAQEWFRQGKPDPSQGAVPCGQCLDCRLKTRRSWAIRCLHEFDTSDQIASFLTFTFSTPALKEHCPLISYLDPFQRLDQHLGAEVVPFESYSIVRAHMQKFNKDFRERLAPQKFRFLYCGEYGGKYQRPHYHSICFGYDFPDRKFYKRIGSKNYYNSEFLSSLWPHGHAVISDFSFDAAGYVAGYVTEKIGGKGKEFHYKGRLPEFAGHSKRPAIGKNWFDKYWQDIYPRDECVVNIGRKIMVLRPPRAYDKWMEEKDPDLFAKVKEKRKLQMLEKADDNTFDRLLTKAACTKAKFSLMVKRLENEND